MAVTMTITVTNAQATRVAAAFGHATSVTDPTWVPATMAEVQAWIMTQVRRRTLDYEHDKAVVADAVTREIEVW